MLKIRLSELTIKKIKNRKFKTFLPEFYELEKIVENNPWHTNDSVLNHTISVLLELKQLLKKLNDRIKVYLGKKIDIYSKRELLFLTALFHDIGKKETFEKEKDITKCPGHEKVGTTKLKIILSKFDLSKNEKEFITKIVRNHGFIHEILNFPEKNLKKKLEEFKKRYSDIFLEVILLSIADMLGSQLKNNKSKEFNFRMTFLNKVIND